jgi:flagellar biosynthesis anti-sigma factor FlgM
MRINTYGNPGVGVGSLPAASPSGAAATQDSTQATDAATQGAARVTVSAKARALADAAAQSADVTKVPRLREAVESGSLAIDSAKIAQRLVDGEE